MEDTKRARQELEAELEALRAECAATQALIAQSDEACAIADGRGRLRHVSPKLARRLGVADGATFAGTHVTELVVEEDRAAVAGVLAATASGAPASSVAVYVRLANADESAEPVRVTLSRAGTGRSVASVLRFDLGRLRHGEMLRVLEAAVDHLDDIVFITEAEPQQGGRRIVFVNRAFTEITGYRPEEVLGKTPSMTIGPATDRAVLRRIEARLRAGRSVHEELLKYRKDGTCYWVELDIVPVRDEDGRHTHHVSVQRDVTERKSRELRAIESERRAAVGAAVGRVGTELQAPLLRVRSSLERASAQLARLGEGPDDARGERVERISAALASARDQTAHLADTVSQVARGANPTESQVQIDVREVLENSLALVRKQLQRTAKVVRAFGPVPRAAGSAAALGQVFVHLLLNAIEALPPDKAEDNVIRVSTRVDHAGWVVVEIEDNGPGIAAELRDRIFLPFFTTKPIGVHEGLGLAHCREALRTMNGALHFESDPGRATIFRVSLPVAGGLDALQGPPQRPANDG